MLFEISIFISAIFILSWLSSRLVSTLVDIAKYLHWREFIIAFFVMAFVASLPNLFVDINAALHGMPQIAFGDVVGGNLVDLTLVLAIAVLFSSRFLPAESEMVQKSAIFTSIIAVLPILLVWDGKLDRIDGVMLLVASFFVISSAQFFSVQLGISLSLVGILIIGLGNCFPEIYFSIISARRGENWMILGDLMGSVIICATLVLGIIALIAPFEIIDFSPFLITRIFTVVASLLFIVFIRTGKKFTKTEGLFFLSIYVLFLLVQIFFPYVIK